MLTLEELFLKLGLSDLDLDGLVNLLLVAALVIGIVLYGGGEKRVDESGLAQARFTSYLEKEAGVSDMALASNVLREDETKNRRAVRLKFKNGHTIIVKAAPRLATILCLWLGRLAIPIGEALSAVAGAMFVVCCAGAVRVNV